MTGSGMKERFSVFYRLARGQDTRSFWRVRDQRVVLATHLPLVPDCEWVRTKLQLTFVPEIMCRRATLTYYILCSTTDTENLF